jgi:amino acid adenylation domain-containing protein
VIPDQLVGLCVSPSPEMVVAIVGVLKAGGAYVPMDPGYPADRLAFMIEDSGVPLVLGIGEIPLTAPAVRTVLLDRDWDEISCFPASDPAAAVDGSNLAYMIYTSGSTGRPKGVLIEHRSVRNLAQGLRERLACESLGRPLRNCLSASISFDASVDNWVMLAFGDELHVIGQELRADSTALLRYVREQQVDVLDCAPAQLALLVDEGLLDGSWVPPIITVGGEAVDPQLWGRLAGNGRVAAYNLYGPTECTVEAVVARIGAEHATPVIGRPLANSRIYLLDGHGNPVPPGAVGEIHIAGDGLARGYHRRPELTAEKFAMHTLPGQAPQRLYRTGDFGRLLPDGTLVFLGRRDGLVKLRGHTIELGEVEAVIALMPGVLGVTAIVREDEPGCPILVAYLRGDHAAALSVGALKELAQSKLPAYMVPAAFVIVDQFPLTPSGKVDRKALPRPDVGSLGMHSSYAPPVTQLQHQLAGIWGAFIAAERIGIDDDFFELGGHSLLATRVINRINRDCDVNLALRVLFEQPTIRRLSAAIEQLALSGDTTTTRAESPIAAQPRVARKRPKPEE